MDTTLRDLLLKRASELFGQEWLALNSGMPHQQLQSLVAETELSRHDWAKRERETATSGVGLRLMQPSDKDQILQWRNAPHVAQFMYTNHEIARAEHATWFASALTRDDARHWIIEVDGADVGLALINGIDRQHSRCSWAFYIGVPGLRGKGIGSEVERQVLCYAFNDLQLNKLCCEVIATNAPVIRMHERMGFTREGMLRQHIKRGDEWLDIVQMALLRSEWEDMGQGEAQMSEDFYRQLDRDVARDMAPGGRYNPTGLDTADLDGQ